MALADAIARWDGERVVGPRREPPRLTYAVAAYLPRGGREPMLLQLGSSGDAELDHELELYALEVLRSGQAQDRAGLWAVTLTVGDTWADTILRWRRLTALELLVLERGDPVWPAMVWPAPRRGGV